MRRAAAAVGILEPLTLDARERADERIERLLGSASRSARAARDT
jgi:hypothetical protein